MEREKTGKRGGAGGPLPWAGALILALLVLAVYLPVTGYPFIGLDDDGYITDNRMVRDGLTLEGVRWAFTAAHEANWHPLTWISHMLDAELFGLAPGKHHLVSMLLHFLGAFTVFTAWRKMTGCVYRSFIIAALLAVHPLHVESVAWASERKDVLSALFWWLAILAYLRYVRQPGPARYISVIILFVLGLMSKPMVVTLPFVLLLLDWWPLNRFARAEGTARLGEAAALPVSRSRLLVEKMPLLVLSAVSSVITLLAQEGGGAVWGRLPAAMRVKNALLSYSQYLGKAIWPSGLSVFYPYRLEGGDSLQAGLSALLLAAVTAVAWKRRNRTPWLAAGWLWFLGVLVPVIGLVQVGGQSMADRYAYLPLVGIYAAAAWSVPSLRNRARGPALALVLGVTAVLGTLAFAARHQVSFWRSGEALFGRALEVTERNWTAHDNLGWWLHQEGRLQEAVHHYRESLRLEPANPQSHIHLGVALGQQGQYREAERHFREALRLDPESAPAHYNLGLALSLLGRGSEGERHIREARRLAPESAFLSRQGRP